MNVCAGKKGGKAIFEPMTEDQKEMERMSESLPSSLEKWLHSDIHGVVSTQEMAS